MAIETMKSFICFDSIDYLQGTHRLGQFYANSWRKLLCRKLADIFFSVLDGMSSTLTGLHSWYSVPTVS